MQARAIEMVFLDMGNTMIYFDGSWQEVRSRSAQALAGYLRNTNHFNVNWDHFIEQFTQRLRFYYLERETNCLEVSVDIIVRSFLDEYGLRGLAPAELKAALQAMYTVSQAHWHPEDDTIPTLEVLRKQGYRLGIISNAAYSLDVENLIDKAAIRPYFETILISADIGIRKPDIRIFQTALDRSHVPAGRAVMVGDTLSADIMGAKNAGMRAIWITRHADNQVIGSLANNIAPDAVISRLSHLSEAISSII